MSEKRVPCLLLVGQGYLVDGWSCCECRKKYGYGTFNALARPFCKHCGHERCTRTPREREVRSD